ncbi:MAG: hypothetical protein JO283_05265, partial [Bradyrhizobium sp.]|nr:hypothetical protein [Bradyrhizobium sp.]
ARKGHRCSSETKAFEKIIDDCERFTDAPIITDYHLQQRKIRTEDEEKADAEQKELDALLERAGIDSCWLPSIVPPLESEAIDALLKLPGWRLPSASSAHDLGCRTFRKLVFQLRSVELRKQIMQSADKRIDRISEYWCNVEQCRRDFVYRLRDERCKPRHLKLGSSYRRTLLVFGLFLLSIAWLAPNLREVIAGAVLLAVLAVDRLMGYFVERIATLHRLDVNLQEAIKYVEEDIARAASMAQEKRDLPKLFSERERATGRADDDNNVAPTPRMPLMG